MNPHNQTALLIVMLGVIGVLAVLLMKRRGMRADSDAQSPTPARTVTTRIQTMVKLARHPGAKTDFPRLRVMCKGPAMEHARQWADGQMGRSGVPDTQQSSVRHAQPRRGGLTQPRPTKL